MTCVVPPLLPALQYDSLVSFMINIQNILDGLATTMERTHALASWQDPVATGLLCGLLLVVALALWLLGPRSLIGLAMLWDLRPPPLRDPLPAPHACLFSHLPSRSDRLI